MNINERETLEVFYSRISHIALYESLPSSWMRKGQKTGDWIFESFSYSDEILRDWALDLRPILFTFSDKINLDHVLKIFKKNGLYPQETKKLIKAYSDWKSNKFLVSMTNVLKANQSVVSTINIHFNNSSIGNLFGSTLPNNFEDKVLTDFDYAEALFYAGKWHGSQQSIKLVKAWSDPEYSLAVSSAVHLLQGANGLLLKVMHLLDGLSINKNAKILRTLTNSNLQQFNSRKTKMTREERISAIKNGIHVSLPYLRSDHFMDIEWFSPPIKSNKPQLLLGSAENFLPNKRVMFYCKFGRASYELFDRKTAFGNIKTQGIRIKHSGNTPFRRLTLWDPETLLSGRFYDKTWAIR